MVDPYRSETGAAREKAPTLGHLITRRIRKAIVHPILQAGRLITKVTVGREGEICIIAR
jgi:hypothetical protein